MDRAAIALLTTLFLAAQFGWLPLAILGGQARYVPTWSTCGQALCDCTPTPYCPLCDDTKADPDATCLRLDLSDTRTHETVIALVDSLVAIAPNPDRPLASLPTPFHDRSFAAAGSTPSPDPSASRHHLPAPDTNP